MMVAAMPVIPNNSMSTIPEHKKSAGTWFAFHAKEVIFNENIGISDTKRNEVNTTKTDITINNTTGGIAVSSPTTCGKTHNVA